jgi:hypothetical protein
VALDTSRFGDSDLDGKMERRWVGGKFQRCHHRTIEVVLFRRDVSEAGIVGEMGKS